ncbi:hypothetical protein BM221_005440 [Beauveria bassiana]|uniref:Uncharacterized protein n=1 Tax=Beauveria bassiana TaxID=176275 RepID=A0A2N6NNN3_BEABA|nr:hypothetical protein BM221_005440 [Beauveria bassiana]
MIDVALELRKEYPDVLLSSCTRLPDVITPDGVKYGTRYDTGSLTPWPNDERKISKQLRAIHGGLYPQSNLVVADDPMAEVAARTWIDQHWRLNRSELLQKPYYEWLRSDPEGNHAFERLNGEFLANKCEEYEVSETEEQRNERIARAMARMDQHGPANQEATGHQEAEQEAVGQLEAEQEAVGQLEAEQEATSQQATLSTLEGTFQRMAKQYEERERRDRGEFVKWRRDANDRSLSRGDWRRLKPSPGALRRMSNEALFKTAQRESVKQSEQARERRERRSGRAASEQAQGPANGAVFQERGDKHGYAPESSDNHQRSDYQSVTNEEKTQGSRGGGPRTRPGGRL